jgi:hypothetical protein
MRDIDALVQTVREIELILAEHIEPGHRQDCAATVDRIFAAMDRHNVTGAVERLEAGFGVLRVVK